MHRLCQIAIVLLPLGLFGQGVAAAQEPPGPPPHGPAQAAPGGPRHAGPREPMEQRRWQRDAAPPPMERAARVSPPPSQDSRSMSDAVRRVQRSTQGQILGAERVPYEGRSITRVKYMDSSGRVRYMDDPGVGGRRSPQRADNGEP
jgi:hypothetical protein